MPGGRKKKEASDSQADKIVAPNRKKYEDELEAVMNEIKEKDALLKNMQKPSGEQLVSNSPDVAGELRTELKQMAAQKKHIIEKIQEIDGQMKELAKEVSKKRDLVSQLMVGLPYRNEDRFDTAISKLQEQLRKVEYSPSEEKRLKLEVECLEKGKKSLKEYLDLKSEIDELRDNQTELRKKRDDHYKEEDEIKKQEVMLREKQNEQRRKQNEIREKYKEEAAKREQLKKEIDLLYDKRREITSDFRKQQEDYLAITREQRDAERTQRQEEAKRKMEAIQSRQRERVAPAPVDPYKQQKILINTLTNYLNRLTLTTISLQNHSSSMDSSGDEITAQVAKWDTNQGSFLQKKVDQDDKVTTSGGGKRKAKRERKKAVVAVNKASKFINHTPTVFEQFHLLEMMAPTTYAEIPSTIATLQMKLKHYDQMTTSQLPKEPSEVDSQITDDDISHTTDELLLDDAINETMQGDAPDSGTSSPTSKPNLVDTNS